VSERERQTDRHNVHIHTNTCFCLNTTNIHGQSGLPKKKGATFVGIAICLWKRKKAKHRTGHTTNTKQRKETEAEKGLEKEKKRRSSSTPFGLVLSLFLLFLVVVIVGCRGPPPKMFPPFLHHPLADKSHNQNTKKHFSHIHIHSQHTRSQKWKTTNHPLLVDAAKLCVHVYMCVLFKHTHTKAHTETAFHLFWRLPQNRWL
jgi:hypothetical protein